MWQVFRIFILLGICASFLAILWHYGGDFLPYWPDEALFIQPSKNLVEGKGMGTPFLDNLLPGISRRTYWQPPVYFLALGAWGSLFDFNLLSARWFSRILGVLGLLLLFALSRRWGLPPGVSLFCVLWTALDYRYQYNANVARMDILNFVFLLASVMAFTEGMKRQNNYAFLISGLFGALSVLTHLISVPVIFSLFIYLLVRRLWKQSFYFVLPLLLGILAWLIYALQDWTSFVGQLSLQFQRKGEYGLILILRRFLLPIGLRTIFSFLIFATLISLKSKHSPLADWQALVIGVAYLTEVVGVEMWYLGWFIPWGYLTIGMWGNSLLKRWWSKNSRQRTKQKLQIALLAMALLWSGYRAIKTWQFSIKVFTTRSDLAQFMDDLVHSLPEKSTVLTCSVPDPCLILARYRTDLKIYQLSPTPMQKEALDQLAKQADFFVGFRELVKDKLNVPHSVVRTWTIRTPLGLFQPCLVLLSPDRHKNLLNGEALKHREAKNDFH